MKKVVWCGVVLMACLAVSASAMAASGAQRPRRAQKKLDKRFQALDKNHDGSISREEWQGRAKGFDRLDANHDGVLKPEELRAGMSSATRRRGAARRHQP